MQKKLFSILLLAGTLFSFGQGDCSFGTISNNTGNAENISTGGIIEYSGAADFDVPFGTVLNAGHITFNVLKGSANLTNVNVAFLQEEEGLPGSIIQAFNDLVPTSQTLAYTIPDSDLNAYQITIDLPSAVTFQKGKYFLKLSATPGDSYSAWWEITAEEQTSGEFDFIRFNGQPWGGTGYYSKVFQIIGTCAPSGEIQPDYGNVCQQGNASNTYENGMPFIVGGQVISIADDFTVPENTTFHLTDFTINTLLLGGGLNNATIKIRSSESGEPGAVLYSYTNKGPSVEQFNGYHPFPGIPFDVVAVAITFSFSNTPVELQPGTYFVEVIPTPNFSEFLTWETTSLPGIGSGTHTSYDGGTTWNTYDGVYQVFTVNGYCSENLGTNTPQLTSQIQLYPNPVKDILHIESKKRINNIQIYNMEGRKVSSGNDVNGIINMQTLANGTYLVKLQDSDGNYETFKIIKE